MSLPTRFTRHAWVAALLLAGGLAIVPAALRLRHVAYVSDTAGRPPGGPAAAPADRPQLIVPGPADGSLGWLSLTQQMFAQREGRVRHVDYENAPFGHDVFATSPYRWWLGFLAGLDHLWSGRPAGRAVELTALYADPLLLLLLVAAVGCGGRRWLGGGPAAVLVLGLACLYPLNCAFLPGVPSDRGLLLALQLGSLLALLGGLRDGLVPAGRRSWFAAAGLLGGLGLWVSAPAEAPVLAGAALGALLAAAARRRSGLDLWPWRTWGCAGAATVLGAYLAEFFPGHLGAWEFRVVHPLFGLVWLGGADLLERAAALLEGRPACRSRADGAAALVSLLGVAALPAAIHWAHSPGFFATDLNAMRLSLAAGSPSAVSLWGWMLQNGVTLAVAATLAPLVLVLLALGLLCAAPGPRPARAAVAWSLGPVVVVFGWACRQIAWWNTLDAALLVLAAAATAAALALPYRRLGAGLALTVGAVALLPGLWAGWPAGAATSLGEGEVFGLVERDLADWLARHADPAGATVLAPPQMTVALHYYAGIRGLGTFGWDNRDGLAAAVRMVSATTPEEALELFTRRGVTHLVLPSWDPYLDAYARLGQGQVAGTFLERLHEWILPLWLRPVAYPIPSIPGFEGQTVTVLEVVDEQDAATAAARLTEYFLDMGQLDLAAAAGQLLRRYPADLGVAVTLAELAVATGDAAGTKGTVDTLLRRIGGNADRDLPWGQRIGLCVVLGQTHHLDIVGPRLKAALAEADAEKLRGLRTSTLYRLEILLHALGLSFPDAKLAAEARVLLPPDLIAQLGINVQ